ncbi:unnamed protein product, partial [Effrenium voratum]
MQSAHDALAECALGTLATLLLVPASAALYHACLVQLDCTFCFTLQGPKLHAARTALERHLQLSMRYGLRLRRALLLGPGAIPLLDPWWGVADKLEAVHAGHLFLAHRFSSRPVGGQKLSFEARAKLGLGLAMGILDVLPLAALHVNDVLPSFEGQRRAVQTGTVAAILDAHGASRTGASDAPALAASRESRGGGGQARHLCGEHAAPLERVPEQRAAGRAGLCHDLPGGDECRGSRASSDPFVGPSGVARSAALAAPAGIHLVPGRALHPAHPDACGLRCRGGRLPVRGLALARRFSGRQELGGSTSSAESARHPKGLPDGLRPATTVSPGGRRPEALAGRELKQRVATALDATQPVAAGRFGPPPCRLRGSSGRHCIARLRGGGLWIYRRALAAVFPGSCRGCEAAAAHFSDTRSAARSSSRVPRWLLACEDVRQSRDSSAGLLCRRLRFASASVKPLDVHNKAKFYLFPVLLALGVDIISIDLDVFLFKDPTLRLLETVYCSKASPLDVAVTDHFDGTCLNAGVLF